MRPSERAISSRMVCLRRSEDSSASAEGAGRFTAVMVNLCKNEMAIAMIDGVKVWCVTVSAACGEMLSACILYGKAVRVVWRGFAPL